MIALFNLPRLFFDFFDYPIIGNLVKYSKLTIIPTSIIRTLYNSNGFQFPVECSSLNKGSTVSSSKASDDAGLRRRSPGKSYLFLQNFEKALLENLICSNSISFSCVLVIFFPP